MKFTLGLLVFLSGVFLSKGFFAWKNCVKPSNESLFTVKHAHACENKAAVQLICNAGYKIAIKDAFFGHGWNYKAKCDSSWISQDCRAPEVKWRVIELCEGNRTCVIVPMQANLGVTGCRYGLKADLFVDYFCEQDPIPLDPSDTIAINSMQLTPSPLALPGTVNVSATLTIKRHLPSYTTLRLNIQKKVFGLFWLRIPCIKGMGSCDYSNFCEMIRSAAFSKCDEVMEAQGVPCDCPIPTGQFALPLQSIPVPADMLSAIPVPDWVVNGKYWVRAEFLDPFSRHLGCIEVQAEVDVSTP
ncbi:predicted protein [Nematostella vectensis]|uniref:MD-2-related lipid-recognition domain-containing protein n=1 Tax=Nematostella vectensis TaxID=45351 RepID=A7SIM3_NEMVE|nr:predicted protein [Nematostella vectensis]|eukprot:XP_001628494.1 predicted protein [Nematostella vectensis]